ncbi:MAG: hypothetical protein QME83_00305 [Thermodesulfobacteriota bacterium]|nr:hypothetical protein [Thermodesulfobacteriota bacterium]
MLLVKNADGSITLKAQTALDNSFLFYLEEAIEARTEKIISELGLAPASKCQSHVQDVRPLIIGPEP